MNVSLTLALAQINVTVGDIAGNVEKMTTAIAQASAAGADLIAFAEMAIAGYPPEDLVLRPSFQDAAMEAIHTLAEATKRHDITVVTGALWVEAGKIYNSLVVLEKGGLMHRRHKVALPNYGVFDEKRLYTAGTPQRPFSWRGIKLGLLVCEDVWDDGVLANMALSKPDMTLIVNASPYETGKAHRRRERVEKLVTQSGAPALYLNAIGGQDELLFDGRSFVLSHDKRDVAKCSAFAEELALTRWEKTQGHWQCVDAPMHPTPGDHETMYSALVLGLRDYVEKNRFEGVILGLSGGIDSGLTAAIAVDALGPARVRAAMMPSPYTSMESIEDAEACAKALGIAMDSVPIEPGMAALDGMLSGVFKGLPKDTTEENIQARLRGMVLMALSNKFGLMLLTTGNKSEMSVGYATLYGDMCGGFSVLKDLYKTTVYSLSRWRNADAPPGARGPRGEVIPARMIEKAPSAELKPGQKDQDTLPPYAVLDGILQGLVEQKLGVDAVVALGYARDTVVKVLRMLTRAEYKRRQSPPGVKVTGMSFGKDWRYPITNRFKN